MTSTRINQARGQLAAKGMVQTRLITTNTGIDLLGMSGSSLINKFWVG